MPVPLSVVERVADGLSIRLPPGEPIDALKRFKKLSISRVFYARIETGSISCRLRSVAVTVSPSRYRG